MNNFLFRIPLEIPLYMCKGICKIPWLKFKKRTFFDRWKWFHNSRIRFDKFAIKQQGKTTVFSKGFTWQFMNYSAGEWREIYTSIKNSVKLNRKNGHLREKAMHWKKNGICRYNLLIQIAMGPSCSCLDCDGHNHRK